MKLDTKKVLVTKDSGRVPSSVRLLNQWQYAERTVHRLLAAWGRRMKEWDDKAALHRHVWDQAEIIRRLRDRIGQFPGGKPDAEVPAAFEKIAHLALHAPSFEDAVDAIYKILLQSLVKAYVDHVQRANPIHDAPSIALLHEINTIKEQHFFWYRNYRRGKPHTTDAIFEQALRAAIAEVDGFRSVFEGPGISRLPCRPEADFELPKVSYRPDGWAPDLDIGPYFSADFADNVETRRLFWGVGYMQEMSLPDDQLAWLYYGDFMPWEWHHDISRHLWDESRHGCSGLSRLKDWGIELRDVGFYPYSGEHLLRHPPGTPLQERMIKPFIDEKDADFTIPMKPMTPQDLYEAVFSCGMVAESGHFIVKNEAYTDFQKIEDLESAEMVLFDIIDETAHVQYAHKWLPLLAQHAGVDNSNYRQRGVDERKKRQAVEDETTAEGRKLPRDESFAPWKRYDDLLQRVRQSCPPAKAAPIGPRSPKPM